MNWKAFSHFQKIFVVLSFGLMSLFLVAVALVTLDGAKTEIGYAIGVCLILLSFCNLNELRLLSKTTFLKPANEESRNIVHFNLFGILPVLFILLLIFFAGNAETLPLLNVLPRAFLSFACLAAICLCSLASADISNMKPPKAID